MFGNFEAAFSLPPSPFDKGETSRRRRAAPAVPRAPGPSPLESLTAALEALSKLDKSYSAAVTSTFSAIGSLFGAHDKAGLFA